MKRNFPALDQFFGGYLHQDFDLDYGDAEDAVKAFLNEASSDQLQNVLSELHNLIPVIESVADQPKYLHQVVGCDYNPTAQGMSVPDWLKQVEKVLSAHVTSPKT